MAAGLPKARIPGYGAAGAAPDDSVVAVRPEQTRVQ
jgi:hypothetical protein